MTDDVTDDGVDDAVLEAIRRRRVVRAMTDEPVPVDRVERILEAARWAPTAGNRHLHRFVATVDPDVLRVLRMVSPGMLPRPTAAITICVDRALAGRYGFAPGASVPTVDVGTALATMLLAAHALDVAAGPVSSFSRAAVGVVLDLPEGWSPEMIVCLGRAAPVPMPPMSSPGRPGWRDLVRWVPATPRVRQGRTTVSGPRGAGVPAAVESDRGTDEEASVTMTGEMVLALRERTPRCGGGGAA